MKVLQVSLILFLSAFVSMNGQSQRSQRIRLMEGSLASLRGEKEINIEFAYDNIRVGKYDKEEDYVNKLKEDYNRKEPGRGDSWAKYWYDDRHAKYEPQFEEWFEKYNDLKQSSKAKYTLIFKTTFIEPGFNVGIMRKSAYINAEVWIVETANKNNVIAKISIEKAPGRMFYGNDFDTGERISEAYADAGRTLARFIKDKS
jgi:hypothetical protein